MSKSIRCALLGRNKGVVASSGRSAFTILPLALMTLFVKYKSSCLMVSLTSKLTFTHRH